MSFSLYNTMEEADKQIVNFDKTPAFSQGGALRAASLPCEGCAARGFSPMRGGALRAASLHARGCAARGFSPPCEGVHQRCCPLCAPRFSLSTAGGWAPGTFGGFAPTAPEGGAPPPPPGLLSRVEKVGKIRQEPPGSWTSSTRGGPPWIPPLSTLAVLVVGV